MTVICLCLASEDPSRIFAIIGAGALPTANPSIDTIRSLGRMRPKSGLEYETAVTIVPFGLTEGDARLKPRGPGPTMKRIVFFPARAISS